MEQFWAKLTDRQLLKIRICDLGLRFEESHLQNHVEKLHKDLQRRGLDFRPKVYFGDEWFSPEGVNAISVPFYLAHPRLRALEKKMTGAVEGSSPTAFAKLLRHEAGHCFDHCYGFSKKREWTSIFGPSARRYLPDRYGVIKGSRDFVRHLEDHYAQSHPDEDFAETFAVWLAPKATWRKKYRNWTGAIRKLEYVNRVASQVISKPKSRIVKRPRVLARHEPQTFASHRLRSTLGEYYLRRRSKSVRRYLLN